MSVPWVYILRHWVIVIISKRCLNIHRPLQIHPMQWINVHVTILHIFMPNQIMPSSKDFSTLKWLQLDVMVNFVVWLHSHPSNFIFSIFQHFKMTSVRSTSKYFGYTILYSIIHLLQWNTLKIFRSLKKFRKWDQFKPQHMNMS